MPGKFFNHKSVRYVKICLIPMKFPILIIYLIEGQENALVDTF